MDLNLVIQKHNLTRDEADQAISDVANDACRREGVNATGSPYFVKVGEDGAYYYRVPTDRPDILTRERWGRNAQGHIIGP